MWIILKFAKYAHMTLKSKAINNSFELVHLLFMLIHTVSFRVNPRSTYDCLPRERKTFSQMLSDSTRLRTVASQPLKEAALLKDKVMQAH